ncbi:MAG TPA: hypothetical protein VMU92_08470 [Acidobacteriaceae bacterium]|nr:hypothetical protein [Acidobacteriaceae bacterium]
MIDRRRNNLHFYLNDWLGTRRVQTDYSGVVEQDCMSLPYGDSETCEPTPAENLYTGKARDAETAGGVSPFGANQGNDYFGARYYSSVMGRWLSPDYGAGPGGPGLVIPTQLRHTGAPHLEEMWDEK